jgi:uncharacterized phage protein gp47/JayE
LDTSPDQPMGQVVGSFSAELAQAWAAIATVYNAINPNGAEGNLLANLASLTGTLPQTATYSQVTCSCTVSGAVTIPANSIVAVTGQPANQWVLTTAIVAGSSGSYNGTFRSSQSGPFVANPGTITTIVTPVSGWTAVTNAAAAVTGLAADTDATLRLKQANELAGLGGGDTAAIRASLLKVSGVLQAFVYENTSLYTDANGVPGKSFHAVIWDGAGDSASNTAIAQAIWNEKPSGIYSYGSLYGTATDSFGNSQVVYFDRVTQVPIYVVLTTNPGTISAANISAIKAALVAYAAANWQIGVDVYALALQAQALLPGVVTDVPTFYLGTAPSPGSDANIPMGVLQIPTLSTTNILVDGS